MPNVIAVNIAEMVLGSLLRGATCSWTFRAIDELSRPCPSIGQTISNRPHIEKSSGNRANIRGF
jgi:hypothetical protein